MESKQTVDDILKSLEDGLRAMMDSEKYKSFLNTMSKFHNYSLNNTLLIAMQRPDASLVAGYNAWQKNFGRQVNKGEKGIKILAPAPYKKKLEREKIDPDTKQPIVGSDGRTQKEYVEVTVPAFKPVTVFDVAQTSGKEIPSLGIDELDGSVKGYQEFRKALEIVSPVPIAEMEIQSGAKGYFSPVEQKIALQKGMSEIQSIKTMIHEIAHALLHDKDGPKIEGVSQDESKGRRNKEVEAESVAYAVCQHFGIDTSEYSFGYVAGWSSGKELTELKESMDTIKKTASMLISGIEEQIQELSKDKEKEEKLADLANSLDVFAQIYDPYGYADNLDKSVNQVEVLVTQLHDAEKREGIRQYLMDAIEENAAPEFTVKAEGLLERVDELFPPKEKKKTKEVQKEALPKKESIKEQMTRLKDKVVAESSKKDKVPVKGKEIETNGK